MPKHKVFVAAAALGGVLIFFALTRPPAAPSAVPNDAPAPAPAAQADAAPQGEALSADEVRYRIVQDQSKAEFVVDETLNGKPFTVVGTTGNVAGEFVLNGKDLALSRMGEVRINARTLKTDSTRRDGAISRMILRSNDDANEFIVFAPTRLEGVPSSAGSDKEFAFKIIGDLTVAGQTREASFDAAARLMADGPLVASAKTVVRYKDFGLTIPKVPFVAWVADEVELTIDLVAQKAE